MGSDSKIGLGAFDFKNKDYYINILWWVSIYGIMKWVDEKINL